MSLLLARKRIRALGLVGDADREADTAGFLEAPKRSLKTGAKDSRAANANSLVHFINASRHFLRNAHDDIQAQFLVHTRTVEKKHGKGKFLLA